MNSSDQFDAMGGKVISCADGIFDDDAANKKQVDTSFLNMTSVAITVDFGKEKRMVDIGTNQELSFALRYDSASGTPKFIFITQ
jgi:hypothetical protein